MISLTKASVEDVSYEAKETPSRSTGPQEVKNNAIAIPHPKHFIMVVHGTDF
jgi:hypothetical protein